MFVKILSNCLINVTFHVKRLIYFHFHKHKKILCVYSNIFYYFIIKRLFFRLATKFVAHIQKLVFYARNEQELTTKIDI